MRVMAQVAMVMNLDKCIGCHTCSVTCKQTWTNRDGTEYVWFNNVETKPGIGYPKYHEDQQRWCGGWVLDRRGKLKPRSGGKGEAATEPVRQPEPAVDRRLLRADHLRLRHAAHGSGWPAHAGDPTEVGADRQGHRDHVGRQLGGRPRRRARACAG